MSTQQDGPSLPSSPHLSSTESTPLTLTDDPNSRSAAIELFVMELRELWRRKGEPKFSAMAARASVSRTSLNDAITRFDRLPSERVLTEFVRILDPDQLETWLERRAALAAPKEPPPVLVVEPADAPPPRRRPAWLIPTIVAAVTGLLSGGIGFVGGRMSVAQPESETRAVKDGDDPIHAKCISDTMLVNFVEVPNFGRLELKHSPSCNSYWGRILRKDKQDQNRMVVRICRPHDPGNCQQEDLTHTSAIYTSMLVSDATRSSRDAMCVSGEIYVGQKATPLSKNPIC